MQITSIVILFAFWGGIQVSCNNPQEVDVLILGAGLAGLTAAKTLSENNITNFLILEACYRIGGRIKHGYIDTTAVELGVGTIVGTDGNPVWDLAQQYGLQGRVADYDSLVTVDEDGNDVTDTEAAAAYVLFEKALTVVDNIYSEVKWGDTDDMSVRSALKRGSWHPDTPVKRTIEWYDYDFYFYLPPDLISLKADGDLLNQLLNDGSDDEYLVGDQQGFVHVLKEMKDEFLSTNDARLKLSEVVETVAYSDSKVTVTTKDNKVYSAKYAIITFGLGVLQNHLIKFEPPLPQWKEENLFQLQVGHMASVMMKCPPAARAFMKNQEYALYASENYGFHTVWVNFNKGVLPPNSNIIASLPTGDEAKRVERIDTNALKSEITKLLRNVNKNPNLDPPSHILVSDWSKNPFFMGSSASPPPKFTDEQMEAVQAPLGRLHFAGDTYHSIYMGFLQGAYYTGREQAEKIVDLLSGSIPVQIPSVFVITICAITSYVHL